MENYYDGYGNDDSCSGCEHGLDVKYNDIGEKVCFCELYDCWRNITLGDCIGNCDSDTSMR